MDALVSAQQDYRKKQYAKKLALAKEAIYFKPVEEALKLVKELEKEFDIT